MTSTRTSPAFVLLKTATGDALACLNRSHLTDDAVHAARKSLKKARTALRLLRPVLDDDEYRAQNVALRDAGRCLSPLRDARVLLGTFETIFESRRNDELKQHVDAIDALRMAIETRRAQASAEILTNGGALERCAKLIGSCRMRLSRRELAQETTEAMKLGLITLYRKARKAFRRATDAGTPENLHEWRKQTKHLYAALSIFPASDVHGLRKNENLAHDISDWLGNDHDLVVLRDLVRAEPLRTDAVDPLIESIENRRLKLQRKAFAEGKKLFAEKPKQFLS